MRNTLLILFLIGFSTATEAQKTRNGAWFTPSSCATNRINGLAVGAFIGCFEEDNQSAQTINGMDVELVGIGFLLPLVGGDGAGMWKDTLRPLQIVNGIVISMGGFAGMDGVVNGLNLSGLNTMTGKANGLTTGMIFCLNRYVNGLAVGGMFTNKAEIMNGIQVGGLENVAQTANGIQIGVTNRAKTLKGLQIGLINSAKSMKGVQIGLWNESGKRGLPFLNLQF